MPQVAGIAQAGVSSGYSPLLDTLPAQRPAGAVVKRPESPVATAATGFGCLPNARVIGTERGFFAEIYLRVRDFLVDKFPSLDAVLPDGQRSGAEKAHVYARKVRDTVRALDELRGTPGANEKRRTLGRRLDAFLTITKNARASAQGLHSRLTSDPPRSLKGSDKLEAMKERADRDRQSAEAAYDFALNFARVVSDYPETAAFGPVLKSFVDGAPEAQGLVEERDLLLFARSILIEEVDRSDINHALRQQSQHVHGEINSAGSEIRTLTDDLLDMKVSILDIESEIKEFGPTLQSSGDCEALLTSEVVSSPRGQFSTLKARHEEVCERGIKVQARLDALKITTNRLGATNRRLEVAETIVKEAFKEHRSMRVTGQDRRRALEAAAKRAGILAAEPDDKPCAKPERRPEPTRISTESAAAILGQTDSIQPYPF